MRPLSVGELLDAAFSAVRRNFGPLVLCVLVVVVPVSILGTLISASSNEAAFDLDATTTTSSAGLVAAGTVANGLIGLVAQTLAAAACLRLVGADVLGNRVGAGGSLRYAAKRLGPLLLVAVLYALALFGGLLLLLVGAIWLGILFIFATPALLFEGKRGTEAMGRSRQLVKGSWWRVFGVMVVGYLIVIVLTAVVGAIVGLALINSDSELTNAIALTVVNILALALALPFTSALLAYVYFDLRVRKEGFDLALLARGIGEPDAAPSQVEGLPASDGPSSGGGFLPPQPPPPGG